VGTCFVLELTTALVLALIFEIGAICSRLTVLAWNA
jgi:hypothetical protein